MTACTHGKAAWGTSERCPDCGQRLEWAVGMTPMLQAEFAEGARRMTAHPLPDQTPETRVEVRPQRMDERGRCCGRKPLVYKRMHPPPQHFCCRCDRAYALDTGEQIENWQWKKTASGNFTPTYTADRDITGRKRGR